MPYSMKVSVHHSSDRSCAEPATFSKSALLPKASSLMQPSAGGSGVDQPESSSSLPLPPPWGSACLQMNPFFFGRSFMPMMPFGPCPMPGTVSTTSGLGSKATTTGNSSSKSSGKPQQQPMLPPMMPMMPPFFPHPAQMQAMTAAAQAAMAQMNKAGMPFPPFMMPPGLMPMQQPAAQNVQHAGQPASSKGTKAGTGSPTRISQKDADAEDDEDVPACPDDEVEVDAETEMLFEQVAAMEREKAAAALQAQRADSPGPSIHSACTGYASNHPSCSPVQTAMQGAAISAAVFEEAASLPVAPASAPVEDVPVPWLTFAADDGIDDIDKDLVQLISLPNAAATGANGTPAVGNSSLKHNASSGSVLTSASGATGGATASPAGQAVPATKPKSKLIRIKTTKAPAGASPAVHGNSTGKPPVKGSSSKSSNKNSSRKKSSAGASGLSVVKAGVLKKCSSSSMTKAATSAKLASSMLDTSATQLAGVPSEEPSLSILCDFESGLSDACVGHGEDVGNDSLADLSNLLEEPSDADAWDSLVAGATDMELCSTLQI